MTEDVATAESKDQSSVELKFDMIQRGDFVRPGWWHWRCRAEDAKGDVFYGYVLADPLGRNPASETFEKDSR